MKRPATNEYPAMYQSYVDLVKGNNIIKVLSDQVLDMQALIAQIPEEKEAYAYATGKWTIKEVIGHIIDTERVLGYRAMRFARKDETPLPGFDENSYIINGNFNNQSLYSLAHEFALVREANIAMYKNFDESMLDFIGTANGLNASARGIMYMIAGHAIHHMNTIRLKYLLD